MHRPWDHAIDLIPDRPPWKCCGIYSLTPTEEMALQDWLKESLQKGYIRPSKSPMASSFFFVSKKDGKLHPVQNYIPLNDIMVKNEAPLPLISDLLTNYARPATLLNWTLLGIQQRLYQERR